MRRLSRRSEAKKKIFNQSFGRGKKKKGKPRSKPLETDPLHLGELQEVPGLKGVQRARRQKDRQRRLARVSAATPPAGKGKGTPISLSGRSKKEPGRLGDPCGARAPEQEGPTVPGAVRMLLCEQCRQETIQGNDYYIILKE